MTVLGAPIRRYALGLALWAVAVVYLAMTLRYPPAARQFPLQAGTGLLVLTTIDLLSITDTRLGRWMRRRLNPAAAPAGEESDSGGQAKHVRALAWVLAFVALFALIGAAPAIAIYVGGSLRILGRRGWAFSIIVGGLVAALVYALFAYGFRIRL